MKTNTLILSLTLVFTALTGLITCSTHRVQKLHKQFLDENLISSAIHYNDIGLSLDGQSLVLYHVTHPNYSTFLTQRVQISHTTNQFKIAIRGLNGSIISHFQEHTPFSITDKIFNYNPNTDLLNQPLISLAILGLDSIHIDASIIAKKISASQISCDIFVQDKGHLIAHFTSRIKATPSLSLYENIKKESIPMTISYLDSELKQRLDAYTFSKQLPFVMEKQSIPFSLLQK